jgi:hypothetical protein
MGRNVWLRGRLCGQRELQDMLHLCQRLQGVLWTSELWAVRSSQSSSKWLHVPCWLTARDFLIFRFSVSAKPIITIGPQVLARFDIFVQDGRAR